MKRHLLTVARLLFAVAGVAYIVWTLTWTDRVVLPAGSQVADVVLAEQVEAYVLQMPAESDTEQGDYVVALPGAAVGESTRIPASDVGLDEQGIHFKPGILTTLAQANGGLLILGLVLIAGMPVIQAWRWWLLMRCRGLDPGYAKAFRLTMVGIFFNFCMPGMTGGDVIKAYYAAKGSGRRTTAVMSVIFDRAAGMFGLVLVAGLAGIAGLLLLDDPIVLTMTLIVWGVLLSVSAIAAAYFSHRMRKLLGIGRLVHRLSPENPLVRIDAAAVAYREHLGSVRTAVLISIPAHLCQILAAAVAGHALGIQTPMGLLIMVLPVVFFAGTMPISYQGLGVMEAVMMALLLDPPMATANQIVSMLMVARLYIVCLGLVGSLFVLRGNIHLFPQENADDSASDGEHAAPVAEHPTA